MVRAPQRELKWLLPVSRSASASQWLDRRLRVDSVYPSARVVSIYFDTPRFRSAAEKAGSDFLKTKVRLRWYTDVDGDPQGEQVFLEIKRKQGLHRTKTRRALEMSAREIARMSLDDPVLVDQLRVQAAELASMESPLQPVLALTYRRRRWVDPASGVRIALDDQIGVRDTNPRLIPGHCRPTCRQAVIEVKGAVVDLPWSLRPIVEFGARRGSFSKYAGCYEATMRNEGVF